MLKKLSFHQIAWYFFVFSILGMILENIVCLTTSGVIESRKGFIIGPFCPIYGLGAIILIMFLEQYKQKKYKIFLYGMLIGAAFEYYSSFAMQALYGVKFWDYPNLFLNINGRTCLIYALSWGVLSLMLIYWVEPLMNRFITDINSKKIDKILISFMLANALVTYWAIDSYSYRVEEKISNDTNVNGIISNKAMSTIFPNMIYVTKNNEKILISKIFHNDE